MENEDIIKQINEYIKLAEDRKKKAVAINHYEGIITNQAVITNMEQLKNTLLKQFE